MLLYRRDIQPFRRRALPQDTHGRFIRQLRDGAEIMSRFISACILTPAAQHCSGSITHCLKNVAA